jgi:AcrR family transcriptional regulator
VSTEEDGGRPSLRAEQVAQTRAALVAAGRRLFGAQGFAATSVDELAREARVTTGALYHHFPTKAALFEAVFLQAHTELLEAAGAASAQASDPIELLSLGFESFLDAVVHPDIQRILITDAPAVLGLERFTELDEQPAFPVLVLALLAAEESGHLRVGNPEILARLLLGTLTRAALLIAGSPTPAATRDEVARTIRDILRALGSSGN